jgi:hypothetical protein
MRGEVKLTIILVWAAGLSPFAYGAQDHQVEQTVLRKAPQIRGVYRLRTPEVVKCIRAFLKSKEGVNCFPGWILEGPDKVPENTPEPASFRGLVFRTKKGFSFRVVARKWQGFSGLFCAGYAAQERAYGFDINSRLISPVRWDKMNAESKTRLILHETYHQYYQIFRFGQLRYWSSYYAAWLLSGGDYDLVPYENRYTYMRGLEPRWGAYRVDYWFKKWQAARQ